jgi:hypothetical protein
MRFILLTKSDENVEAGKLPGPEVFEAVGKFNEALAASGKLLSAEGLDASSKGARVTYSGTERTVLDGPFADPTSLVAGFWLIDVASKQEAVEIAASVPFTAGEVEVRQLFDMPDAE